MGDRDEQLFIIVDGYILTWLAASVFDSESDMDETTHTGTQSSLIDGSRRRVRVGV
jgi:hypothetical protein